MSAGVTIILIWWAAIIITAFKNNSVSILRKRNIPFKAKGYTASPKSVREIIIKYSDDKELVRKLKKALFYSKLSTVLLIGWILVMLLIIFLGQE